MLTEELETKLRVWHETKQQMAALSAKEIDMRKEIFAEAFPEPTEGSSGNKLEIGDGFILQGDYKITRTLDEAAYHALLKTEAAPVVNGVTELKPKLDLRRYKALLPDARLAIAEMILEKPGTPALSIVQPKKGK